MDTRDLVRVYQASYTYWTGGNLTLVLLPQLECSLHDMKHAMSCSIVVYPKREYIHMILFHYVVVSNFLRLKGRT